MLESLVCWSQGNSHPVGNAAFKEGRGAASDPQFGTVSPLRNVPRPRRAWRAALHAAEGGAATARAPPAAPGLQGLLRLLPVGRTKSNYLKISCHYHEITHPYYAIRMGY